MSHINVVLDYTNPQGSSTWTDIYIDNSVMRWSLSSMNWSKERSNAILGIGSIPIGETHIATGPNGESILIDSLCMVELEGFDPRTKNLQAKGKGKVLETKQGQMDTYLKKLVEGAVPLDQVHTISEDLAPYKLYSFEAQQLAEEMSYYPTLDNNRVMDMFESAMMERNPMIRRVSLIAMIAANFPTAVKAITWRQF